MATYLLLPLVLIQYDGSKRLATVALMIPHHRSAVLASPVQSFHTILLVHVRLGFLHYLFAVVHVSLMLHAPRANRVALGSVHVKRGHPVPVALASGLVVGQCTRAWVVDGNVRRVTIGLVPREVLVHLVRDRGVVERDRVAHVVVAVDDEVGLVPSPLKCCDHAVCSHSGVRLVREVVSHAFRREQRVVARKHNVLLSEIEAPVLPVSVEWMGQEELVIGVRECVVSPIQRLRNLIVLETVKLAARAHHARHARVHGENDEITPSEDTRRGPIYLGPWRHPLAELAVHLSEAVDCVRVVVARNDVRGEVVKQLCVMGGGRGRSRVEWSGGEGRGKGS